MRRRGTAFVLLLVLACLIPLAGRDSGECLPAAPVEVRPDAEWTRRFAAFGNDNTRTDDWTGADGTWSVRLPGGRTLWIFADTFLGTVAGPPNRNGEVSHWRSPGRAPLIRNSALLQEPDGAFTMVRGTRADGAPDSWIRHPEVPGTAYWPMSAVVEPEYPGARTDVLRVFAVQVAPPEGRHVFGVLVRGAVATFALDDLSRPIAFTEFPAPPPPDGRWTNQVFYGSQVLVEGEYVYIYGGTGNSLAGGQSAYLARALRGAADRHAKWHYWSGRAASGADMWSDRPDRARPILPWTGSSGVSPGYSVMRTGSTYLLFTMDPTVYAGSVSRIASYWSCLPTGPWHGPTELYRPPEVRRGSSAYSYFPVAHPTVAVGEGELLLSYDVNADFADVHHDVGLYRPRFLRVRIPSGR
ncbi:hypothetical protein [Planobispora longispora]|uniref:hypothetical protein n=1 Tax=Planobispora longispora TaxID=28887 RepID=UPI00194494BA|nr:hypothetical protein [Planobispora longispora]